MMSKQIDKFIYLLIEISQMSSKVITSAPVAPDSPSKQPKYKLKVFTTTFLGLIAIVIAAVSHMQYQSLSDYVLFADAKFKKFQSQIQMLTCLSYHFSLFTIANVFLMFILTSLFNRAYDNMFVMALRRNISNSLEQFIIFIGLYAYVLTEGGFGLDKTQLILVANWFIFGRYLYAFGSLLQAKTGYNFRELGVVLNAVSLVALVLQIFGFSIFQLI